MEQKINKFVQFVSRGTLLLKTKHTDTITLYMDEIPFPICKRIFDLIMTTLIGVIFLPIIIVIILFYLVETLFKKKSWGPLLYSETRVSQGKQFTVYKFRVFTIEAITRAINKGIVHTKELERDDDNLTTLGKALKQVYLDELPQLYNIIKGDMTLVGPRPTNIENYNRLVAERKMAKKILRAGLTGYFQSHKGFDLQMDQNDIDMKYASFLQNANCFQILWYDFKIILISIKTVLRAEGI